MIGAYGGNNLRSAVASNAGAYFAGGSSGTVFNNISNTTIQSTVTNTRVVKIINGKLYFSTASGTNRGVWTFDSALPTSAATASILVNQGGSGDVFDFTFNSINTVAYLTNGSVLQRWTFDGSAWSLANTSGTIAAGLTGLEVAFGAGSLGEDLIYAVNPSTLFGLSFDGTSFSAATALATAGTNYAFRGLEFSPIPEPATWILVTIGAMAILIRRKLGPVKA